MFSTTNLSILFPLLAMIAAKSGYLNKTWNMLTILSKHIRLVIVYDEEESQIKLVLMVCYFRDNGRGLS